MSSPITISQWPDDVRAAADEAAAADRHHRIGRHLLSRVPCRPKWRRPGRRSSRPRCGSGARCRWRPGGTAGRPPRPSARSAAPGDRPGPTAPSSAAPSHAACTSRDSGRRSGRGEGAGPAHAGMVGGVADRPRHRPPPCAAEGRGYTRVCSPSTRTAAPSPCRRPGRRAPSTAASSCSSPRSARPGSPGPPASARTVRSSTSPARARRQRPDTRRRRGHQLASGVIVPTAPWLIAENAKPGTLNWICNHVQPDHALEGFASQVSAVPGDDVALFVNTTARAVQVQAYRMGYYQGLGGRLVVQTDFVPAKVQAAPGGHARRRHGDLPVVAHPDAQHHEGLAARLLPLEAGRRRRRGAVRPAHHPRRRVHGVLRDPEQRHHLAGLQPVGQLQPLLRARTAAGGPTFANRARAVSFDRPYPQTWASGAADFVGNELPAAVPPREPRAGPDLLDRRRPARPAAAAR